ncbi:maleate cis-trans isomerase family protein [Ensifer adhaerens]|uniref:maleate cis-trans isomerase family protein n=1 Tax=Ensifer adhaerens TaxID=106592 RepID=UPI00131A1AB3|nr:aspartate/glutamate racemase family protein [Ensifer adhaerens]
MSLITPTNLPVTDGSGAENWQHVAMPMLRNVPVHRPAIGLIELTMETAMSGELHRFLDGTSAGIYTSRVPFSGTTVGTELSKMGDRVVAAADLLPEAEWLDCIVYGCTSGSAFIGHDRLTTLIETVRPEIPVITPIGAVARALNALKVRKIAVATPYVTSVNAQVAGVLSKDGFEIVSGAAFHTEDGFAMMLMPPECFVTAALAADSDSAEAIFISCTGIVVGSVIAEIEERTGKPVVTSNQAIAWQCLETVGAEAPSNKFGRLFSRRLIV